MRQRRLKNLDEKLGVYSGGITINPKAMKGSWQSLFEKEQPVYLELGCGKGQFSMKHAIAHPDRNYIAVEGNRSVMLRALEKASRMLAVNDVSDSTTHVVVPTTLEQKTVAEEGMFSVGGHAEGSSFEESLWSTDADDCIYRILPNLIFANMYLRQVTDCFEDGELSGLYLNFSDPWPKDRHAKRRLTHRGYLNGYRQALKPGSCLEFKTDNEKLFRFSVEEFKENGLETVEYTEDLHPAGRGAAVDEFESAGFMTEYEEKFSSMGNPIYYTKVRF